MSIKLKLQLIGYFNIQISQRYSIEKSSSMMHAKFALVLFLHAQTRIGGLNQGGILQHEQICNKLFEQKTPISALQV